MKGKKELVRTMVEERTTDINAPKRMVETKETEYRYII